MSTTLYPSSAAHNKHSPHHKHQFDLDADDNNKTVNLVAMFSGKSLQIRFNNNIGLVIPGKKKQSVKTRTLILIILAIICSY